MWVATRTRPDVSYATSLVSRLLHKGPRYAKELADHVFAYLAGTIRSGLRFAKDDDYGSMWMRHLRPLMRGTKVYKG